MTSVAIPARVTGLIRKLKGRFKKYLYPDLLLARRQYFFRNGFYPDLSNPRDLSEKVLWLKLHDRSPLHTQCADKIKVRDYVAARIGSDLLVPLLFVTYDLRQIGPEAIVGDRFVLKTNHDQGGIFICRDRAKFDWATMKAQIEQRSKTNKYYEFRERQYKDIRPGILVEAFIEGEGEREVLEFKVNCFHGEPRFVQVIADRHENRRHANYDIDWRRMALHGRTEELERELPRPACLDRMLAAASALAQPFLFCRIDFLVGVGGRPWFSEITFHPAAGLVRYKPPEMERALGDMIELARFDEFRQRQRAIWSLPSRPEGKGSRALVRDAG